MRYLDIGQLQLARDHFGQAITIDSDYAEPHFNLSSLLIVENNTQGAIEELRRAVEIAPDYAEAHNNLGGLLASVGLVDDAVIYYRLAIQFNPRHSEALYNLGNVMLSRGMRVAAIQHYRDALRYAPNDAEVHSNLARLVRRFIDGGVRDAQCRSRCDGQRRSFRRLVGAEHPEVLDTLAAAYAAEGRFDDAVATAQKAAAAARATPGYESTATDIHERVNSYILFKPYRTP